MNNEDSFSTYKRLTQIKVAKLSVICRFGRFILTPGVLGWAFGRGYLVFTAFYLPAPKQADKFDLQTFK
jgi:hypothetical protein